MTIAAHRRSRAPAMLALVAGLALPPTARAGEAGHMSGAWDLVGDEAHRCRVTLRAAPSPPGFALAMPAGCRRAFPVLNAVASWADVGEGRVGFDDASGTPVIVFEPADDGLKAVSPAGEIYRLNPVNAASRAVLAAAAAEAPPPTAAKPAKIAATARTPSAKGPAVKPADVAGRYSVLRDEAKDTGCMVTLDDQARGPKNSFKARLAPACRDQGIVIFDPVGWEIAAGRLVLTARKGHTTRLDHQEDGSWLKEPGEGKGLSLKRM